MITRLVAFALHQRFITLALAFLLTVGGIISYHRLPIEAYPDVADVQVDVITIWPGHAAEEVERLITVPLEKELNGIAGITFLRSVSNFGLSNIHVLFAAGTDNYWSRQQVLERITGAEPSARAGCAASACSARRTTSPTWWWPPRRPRRSAFATSARWESVTPSASVSSAVITRTISCRASS